MITGAAIAADAIVTTNPQAVACDLEGEVVILNLESGVYFGLNAVGGDIWNYIQSEHTIEEIIQHLLQQYRVERSRCEAEVNALLQTMATRGLVKIETR